MYTSLFFHNWRNPYFFEENLIFSTYISLFFKVYNLIFLFFHIFCKLKVKTDLSIVQAGFATMVFNRQVRYILVFHLYQILRISWLRAFKGLKVHFWMIFVFLKFEGCNLPFMKISTHYICSKRRPVVA